MRLSEARKGIRDSIVSLLEAEMVEDGMLEQIHAVVYGQTVRPRPRLPALWVMFDVAQNQHDHQALREEWMIPVALVSMVNGDEPEELSNLAETIAEDARTVLLRNRRLDLKYVRDIKSHRFEFAHSSTVNHERVWSSAAICNVTFTVDERV